MNWFLVRHHSDLKWTVEDVDKRMTLSNQMVSTTNSRPHNRIRRSSEEYVLRKRKFCFDLHQNWALSYCFLQRNAFSTKMNL